MGDPRKFRSKYSRPGHPWQRARLETEKVIKKEYGLKNKKELWKAVSKLKRFQEIAKKLVAAQGAQAELEKGQILQRVARLGLLPAQSKLDDILALTVKDLLNRRLQTFVLKKGMARTPSQARQYIIHEHVIINGKTVNAPSYIVPLAEEGQIMFLAKSSLANPEHPERTIKPKPKSTIAREAAKPYGRRRAPRQMRAPAQKAKGAK